MSAELESLVERAKNGDRRALEGVVRGLQQRVYTLAVRMLGDPAAGEDAAQEILVKVVTRLDAFRGDSAFTTWVHRLAVNHLLTEKAQRAAMPMDFETLGGLIDGGLAEASASPPPKQDPVLVEEVRMTCTQAMLSCLDRDHRLAYVLGEILELTSDEGAQALELSPDAFRKRLQRARERIQQFVQGRCGVVDAKNPCRCSLQVPYAQRQGMLDPARRRFFRGTAAELPAGLEEVEGLLDLAVAYRRHAPKPASDVAGALRAALQKHSERQ